MTGALLQAVQGQWHETKATAIMTMCKLAAPLYLPQRPSPKEKRLSMHRPYIYKFKGMDKPLSPKA